MAAKLSSSDRALNPKAQEFFPTPLPKHAVDYQTSNHSIDLSLRNPPYYILSHTHFPLNIHYQHILIPHHHFSFPELASPLPVVDPAVGLYRGGQVCEEQKPVVKIRGTSKHYWKRKNDYKEKCFRRRREKGEWLVDAKQRPACEPRASEAFSGPTRVNVRRSGSDNDKPPILQSGRQKHRVMVAEELDDRGRTTVMIRNIPNRYTREMLKDFLDQHCLVENQKPDKEKESAFDFLYLPIDFMTKSNKGYAFVNFTNQEAVGKFFLAAHDKAWGHFRSSKIRELCYARLQGKGTLVGHFESMEFPCEEFQPQCFKPARDGSRKLVEEISVGRCNVKLLAR